MGFFSPKSGSPVFTAAPPRGGGARLCLGLRWLQPPEALGSFVEHHKACFAVFLWNVLVSRAASPFRESGRQARGVRSTVRRREPPRLTRAGFGCAVRTGVHLTCLFLGNVTSAPGSQMASGVSLGSFTSRADGMQQRSYSVSSADQWSEATVIANSAISSGKREARPRGPGPPCGPRLSTRGWRQRSAVSAAALPTASRLASSIGRLTHVTSCPAPVQRHSGGSPHLTDWETEALGEVVPLLMLPATTWPSCWWSGFTFLASNQSTILPPCSLSQVPGISS